MPWSVHIDYPHRLLVTVAWGALSDSDVAHHDAAVRRHWELLTGLRHLIDVRGVTASRLDTSLTEGHPRPSVARAERGAIVGMCGAQPLVGQLLASPIYAMGARVRPFARLAEAERWLGLTPGDAHLPVDRVASRGARVADAPSASLLNV